MPLLPLWLTRIQLDSMGPCLRDGQLVLTIRPRRNHRPRRGALVVVDSSELGRRIVKRIVGLPGEHLRLEGSKVWVDGNLLDEPYATASTYRGTFEVPEWHYLLLGDNREVSNDSRVWCHPYVARTEIVGVLLPRCRSWNVLFHGIPEATEVEVVNDAPGRTDFGSNLSVAGES